MARRNGKARPAEVGSVADKPPAVLNIGAEPLAVLNIGAEREARAAVEKRLMRCSGAVEKRLEGLTSETSSTSRAQIWRVGAPIGAP